MNRDDFKSLSVIRLQEAKILLINNCFEGAYYLAGYSVECALKACISKNFHKHEFPDKKIVENSYCHNFVTLIQIAGLSTNLQTQIQSNRRFEINWAVVKDWTEEARYRRNISPALANDLFSAISSRGDGVLSWLKKCW